MLTPEEDPHDTRDTILFNELRDHMRHVRHEEFHTSTCRICREEMDMVRGG
jgi:Uma2 family endonuclease